MKKLILTGSCCMVALSGCGGEKTEIAVDPAVRIDTLSVTCEIGEMMGDSNYVFGEITSAVPTPDSGVAVLDVYSCRISFFDGSGRFIRSVGGKGEGPGEFLLPIDFALLEDGRIAVVDLVNRRIDILSENGELLNSLDTDYAMLPFRMAAIADSSFMIYYYSSRLSDDRFDMGFNLEIWNTSGLQQEIWSWRSEYSGADYQFSPGYLSCCAGDGIVYFSEMSCGEFNIDWVNVLDGSGGSIGGEASPVAADYTDAGYIEPKIYVDYAVGDEPFSLESEALRYRPQIGSIGVDEAGRIWVRNGTTDAEEWLIYSSDGDFICAGTIAGIPEHGRLEYVINRHGAVAWAPFSEDYPKVFLLSEE